MIHKYNIYISFITYNTLVLLMHCILYMNIYYKDIVSIYL